MDFALKHEDDLIFHPYLLLDILGLRNCNTEYPDNEWLSKTHILSRSWFSTYYEKYPVTNIKRTPSEDIESGRRVAAVLWKTNLKIYQNTNISRPQRTEITKEPNELNCKKWQTRPGRGSTHAGSLAKAEGEQEAAREASKELSF